MGSRVRAAAQWSYHVGQCSHSAGGAVSILRDSRFPAKFRTVADFSCFAEFLGIFAKFVEILYKSGLLNIFCACLAYFTKLYLDFGF